MALSKAQQQAFTLISGVLFLGSMATSTLHLFTAGASQPPTPVESETSTLAAQAKGYELVLQREPENLIALEGLADTQLAMHNPQAAIAPLTKLAKLNPQNPAYTAKLAEAKQQANQ